MNKKTEEKKANEQNKEVDPLPKNQFSSPKEDEPPALTYKVGCHGKKTK